MSKEEMISIIREYEQELKDQRDEFTEAYGHQDSDSQFYWTQWIVIDELMTRLGLDEESQSLDGSHL